MSASFIAIVPARAASTRLPGKMLLDVHGLPLVIRTAQQANQSQASRVLIATDDKQIQAVAQSHGFEVMLTSAEHPSGTDRLAEVVTRLNLSDDMIVVNVQGDEPLLDPSLINQVAQALINHPQAAIATCAYPITEAEKFFNPNVVKVVKDATGFALYFSRAPIPWARDAFSRDKSQLPKNHFALHHIGLYAYRVGFLKQYPHLSMGVYEQLESLEQLRALEHGYRIFVLQTAQAPLPGVDTTEDLERVRAYFANAA
ncbi:3-deoxy-manno-octulosonate cytidylyltransferase [Pelistega europaea]|uniref:3-deoxy-manno-octulosonate cytidylyltransferase n=1 Tax=Pelistega europaea TaxID=106147 RepID=A0A7Y4LCG2_9BURK|nr:3-deoxy-manno-octulosonate cytidylyltransferase [Pelistega europaea]NOL49721.1 3-deoxy-manno-octulosonate cytidylyltransferase [Pelistega europaea]